MYQDFEFLASPQDFKYPTNSSAQTTRKLHEDLRVHVLEQITEIEGLRQNAENGQKAIQLLETRLQGTRSEFYCCFDIALPDA